MIRQKVLSLPPRRPATHRIISWHHFNAGIENLSSSRAVEAVSFQAEALD
jgi:hypothetical protein